MSLQRVIINLGSISIFLYFETRIVSIYLLNTTRDRNYDRVTENSVTFNDHLILSQLFLDIRLLFTSG